MSSTSCPRSDGGAAVAGEQLLKPFTRRRIESLAEALLQRAGVIGILPTPVEAIETAVGVRERIDIAELPEDLLAQRPAGWERVLGAALLEERTIFIDGALPPARRRFTEAHEIAHLMCTWHEAALMVDTEQTLFRDTQSHIEAEANYAASYLLFQGHRFHQRVLGEGTSIAVPLGLAKEYGASLHSTMHYYVEGHSEMIALLVAGRYSDVNGKLPVWRTVESPLFLQRFGPLTTQLATGSAETLDAVGIILAASHRSAQPPAATVSLLDGSRERVPFRVEAFFNRRCHFLLVTELRAVVAGDRQRQH
jgi:hypothetical protein